MVVDGVVMDDWLFIDCMFRLLVLPLLHGNIVVLRDSDWIMVSEFKLLAVRFLHLVLMDVVVHWLSVVGLVVLVLLWQVVALVVVPIVPMVLLLILVVRVVLVSVGVVWVAHVIGVLYLPFVCMLVVVRVVPIRVILVLHFMVTHQMGF